MYSSDLNFGNYFEREKCKHSRQNLKVTSFNNPPTIVGSVMLFGSLSSHLIKFVKDRDPDVRYHTYLF